MSSLQEALWESPPEPPKPQKPLQQWTPADWAEARSKGAEPAKPKPPSPPASSSAEPSRLEEVENQLTRLLGKVEALSVRLAQVEPEPIAQLYRTVRQVELHAVGLEGLFQARKDRTAALEKRLKSLEEVSRKRLDELQDQQDVQDLFLENSLAELRVEVREYLDERLASMRRDLDLCLPLWRRAWFRLLSLKSRLEGLFE